MKNKFFLPSVSLGVLESLRQGKKQHLAKTLSPKQKGMGIWVSVKTLDSIPSIILHTTPPHTHTHKKLVNLVGYDEIQVTEEAEAGGGPRPAWRFSETPSYFAVSGFQISG